MTRNQERSERFAYSDKLTGVGIVLSASCLGLLASGQSRDTNARKVAGQPDCDLSGTIGQPDAGEPMTNGEYEPTCGFWHEPVASLASSDPLPDESLWRTKLNVATLSFTGSAIIPPAPGEVPVQELLDGGAYGPDLSAAFTFTVVAETDLLIEEPTPGVLSHQIWYAIRNSEWANVAPFEVHYVVLVGDADSNNLVSYADVNSILNDTPSSVPPAAERNDIDEDTLVNFSDVSRALNRIGTGAPPKPTGH